MTTETKTTSPPEYTSLHRVASIPLVASSLDSIHSTLSKNPYLASPYSTAQALAQTAWGYSVPIQTRLAPITTRADGYANAGLDAVESRYPYPFRAKPQEISEYVRERRQSVSDIANKTIDQKVRSPAYGVAQSIDQRFAPIVDYFEVQVNKLSSEATSPSSPTHTKYQYQRVCVLSRNLTENIYALSNEQLKQLQAHNIIVQRATENAHLITNLAQSSLTNAQTRIHSLSDTMLQELQKLQTQTAALPQSLRSAFPDLTSTISDLHNIVTAKDISLNEKANKAATEVREHIHPILDEVAQMVKELIGIAAAKRDEVMTKGNGATNGSAAS